MEKGDGSSLSFYESIRNSPILGTLRVLLYYCDTIRHSGTHSGTGTTLKGEGFNLTFPLFFFGIGLK